MTSFEFYNCDSVNRLIKRLKTRLRLLVKSLVGITRRFITIVITVEATSLLTVNSLVHRAEA